MEAPKPTQNISLKTIKVENEGKAYICKIQAINQTIEATIF